MWCNKGRVQRAGWANSRWSSTRSHAIADLAARGLGVAVLGTSVAASHRDRLTARVIDDVATPALLAAGPATR
ncbi:DNA-binding transcriptional LysR family regulator [Streptomyces achromogenes]|uniref:DNA-binding transcriptional LysR family regulator n=1 Tax=Streptomyces achromogenes TaxID=67255 RepID=A0ABU0QCN2_STRAH|nr:DNA-binding transcriptional LysR family regulator [Streptomyces achromogenes]MDQ0835607.1 DNA-binding transcriptional LysR family regulator [Streptomyces achromogenes]